MMDDLTDLILTGTISLAIVSIIPAIGEWARLIASLT